MDEENIVNETKWNTANGREILSKIQRNNQKLGTDIGRNGQESKYNVSRNIQRNKNKGYNKKWTKKTMNNIWK